MKKALSSSKAKEIIKEYCDRELSPIGTKEFIRIVDVWTHEFAKCLEEYMQSIDNEGQSKKRISDDYVKAAFADFILGGLGYENRR
jgi:hypothetical protein